MPTKKQLKDLRAEYEALPIPDELDEYVQSAIKKGKKVVWIQRTVRSVWVSAAAFAIFTLSINVNPVFAKTLAQIPGMKGIIRVLSFKEYKVEKETSIADINVPKIEGLENQELEKMLNEEFAQTGEDYYQYFIDQCEIYENNHLKVELDYRLLTDTEDIFALKIIRLEIAASSDVQTQFYVIDKKRQEIVTLESLFKSDQYIEIVSENIISQMKEQMKENTNKIYSIAPDDEEPFETIAKDQQFYINEEGKLVISFDKYEVAPGAMGPVEFVIPTEVIQDQLLNNDLIK